MYFYLPILLVVNAKLIYVRPMLRRDHATLAGVVPLLASVCKYGEYPA